MTILSKANLQVVKVSTVEKAIPALNNLRVESDGTTAAANGRVVLAVSPVKKKTKESVIVDETNLPETGCTIPAETVKDVIKNMPKDTNFGGLLEHCDLSVKDNKGQFLMKDGKKPIKIGGNLYRHEYVKYREILGNALKSTLLSSRVVLNLKRLKSLIDAIDKVCPDSSGETPAYIEFTPNDDVVVRAVNPTNGQRAVAVMSSYKFAEGQWMEHSEWEENFYRNLKKLEPKKKLVLKKKKLTLQRKVK